MKLQSFSNSVRVLYYQSQMRRLLSVLLMLIFGLGPLAATLGASEDARLPACCRRHGAHHCAMSMEAAMASVASEGTAVRAPSTCPAFPESTAANPSTPHALLFSSVSSSSPLAQPHSAAAAQAAARLSLARTRSGRAPPAQS